MPDIRTFISEIEPGVSKDDVTSSGAAISFKKLSTAVEDVTEMAKTCRIYIAEIMLLKALKQHSDAKESGDEDSKQAALRVIQKEFGYFGGNALELTKADVMQQIVTMAEAARS